MDVRRVTIATGIGLLTGCYCATSLFIPALKPPEMTSRPEVWWLAMLIIGRTSQGFVVGLADRINIHPVLRCRDWCCYDLATNHDAALRAFQAGRCAAHGGRHYLWNHRGCSGHLGYQTIFRKPARHSVDCFFRKIWRQIMRKANLDLCHISIAIQ